MTISHLAALRSISIAARRLLLWGTLTTLFHGPLSAAELIVTDSPPQVIDGTLPGNCITALGLKYDLPKATFDKPRASKSDKRLHGSNRWVAEGAVSTGPEGLLLDAGSTNPCWASPQLWSGLKTVLVTAKVKVESARAGASCGLKFGNVWIIGAAGPRLSLTPNDGKVSFPDAGANAIQAPLRLPVNEAVLLSACYSYDTGRIEAWVNGTSVLSAALPKDDVTTYTTRFGRPAPLVGLGLFAEGCVVRVAEFSFLAGAPTRRVVAFGDSITQRAYWVRELEKALGEEVTNLGIGGDMTSIAQQRFARDVLPLKPEICILFEGSNDMGGMPPKGLKGAVRGMVLQCKKAGIVPVLCELLPRRGCKQVADYNAELRALGQEEGVHILTWHAATLDPAKGEMKPGFAPDGTHPEQPGAEAMIKAIDLKLLRK